MGQVDKVKHRCLDCSCWDKIRGKGKYRNFQTKEVRIFPNAR